MTRHRPDQPPPVPAAALPGGHRDPLGGRDRPGHPRRPAPAPQRPGRSWPRSTAIDLEAREVDGRPGRPAARRSPTTASSSPPGAATSYFGHDEFGQSPPGMKTIDDALELRGRIFGAFEMAETEADPERAGGWLTFVVVGGGPTGVEMAGQIAELSRRALRAQLPPRSTRTTPGSCSSRAATRSSPASATGSRDGAGRPRAPRRRDPPRRHGHRHRRARRRRRRRRRHHRARSQRRTKVWAAGVQGVAARGAGGRRRRGRAGPAGPGPGRPRLHRCPATPRSSSSAT